MSDVTSYPEAEKTSGTDKPRALLQPLVVFLASGAGAGFVPIAPGTAGSLVGLILARFVLARIWWQWPVAFVALFAASFAASCLIAGSAERIWEEHDSSRIVLDEVFGMIATLAFNPVGWGWLIVGFALFRLFDIIKPWPAIRFDQMRGGAGVMLDDLASGIYANLALQVLHRVL